MRSIIFDLDNTLTDRTATIRRYADVFVEAFRGRLLPEVTPADLFRLFIEADCGGYQGHEKRSELLARSGIWIERVEVEVLSNHWTTWSPNNPEPMAGMYPLLDWLSKRPVTLGMITNGSSVGQRRKIEKLGLADCFDAIVVSEEAGFKKPDRRIFDLAVSQLGTRAEECVFIGDDPTNDYHGALQAGMTPIWFAGFRPWLFEEQAKIKISALQELPETLRDLLKLSEREKP